MASFNFPMSLFVVLLPHKVVRCKDFARCAGECREYVSRSLDLIDFFLAVGNLHDLTEIVQSSIVFNRATDGLGCVNPAGSYCR
jgi:hypothetical protein